MATKKLTTQQANVLRMACTHGHLTQGCRMQSDYGGRICTIYSLRRLGLLDAMDVPTEAGREADKTGRVPLKTPNPKAPDA